MLQITLARSLALSLYILCHVPYCIWAHVYTHSHVIAHLIYSNEYKPGNLLLLCVLVLLLCVLILGGT